MDFSELASALLWAAGRGLLRGLLGPQSQPGRLQPLRQGPGLEASGPARPCTTGKAGARSSLMSSRFVGDPGELAQRLAELASVHLRLGECADDAVAEHGHGLQAG